ncbi:hypothetical protein PRZ48_013333 [Zasmidium cellare]|uniref:Xylanolytic transcriptional activator regulatory domain-containing protein n=1 Tax=Zasmidium cellare TaxID=395010 RepID=A0ABR0E190_ZASCE|nr:hypothetical protein PRZ48_013333 [Zasmidium cellare]
MQCVSKQEEEVRPTCTRCLKGKLSCYYDVEEVGTTHHTAVKRKHEAIQSEKDQLLELYGYIQSRASPEVEEIVRQIRSKSDPFSVLRFIQEGDLLLQRQVSNPRRDARMRKIDADALQKSDIKVKAKPWTTVAGDGIVSHLLTLFFDREQGFMMPFVDREVFLAEMASQDIEHAEFCSPLLVNALCAFAAFTSQYAQAIDASNTIRLRGRFFNEARKLLDNERGRASIATTQAPMILYMYSTSAAMDRSGILFRLSACEMYKRLDLGRQVSTRNRDYDVSVYQTLFAKNAWGLFGLERYPECPGHVTSSIPVPKLPRYFLPSHERTNDPLKTTNIFDAQCEVASIFYRITTYVLSRTAHDIGSKEDITRREALYGALKRWESTVPALNRYPPDSRHYYYYLRAWYHFAAIVIWRPLVDINTVLPSIPFTNVVFLTVSHCSDLLSDFEECKAVHPVDFERGSISTLNFHFHTAFTLVTMLKKHSIAHELFTSICRFFYTGSSYWPAATAILGGLLAVSRQMGTKLPREAESLCSGASVQAQPGAMDVPVGWAIPNHAEFVEMLENGDDTADADRASIELGTLIQKWTSMSVSS